MFVTGQAPRPGGGDGVLWITADGKEWTAVGGQDLFGGPADELLRSVAADGSRVVVTGLEDDDVTVYASDDGGATWKKWTSAVFGGFGRQIAASVRIVGDRVVMTGNDGPSGAVWVGPAP